MTTTLDHQPEISAREPWDPPGQVGELIQDALVALGDALGKMGPDDSKMDEWTVDNLVAARKLLDVIIKARQAYDSGDYGEALLEAWMGIKWDFPKVGMLMNNRPTA